MRRPLPLQPFDTAPFDSDHVSLLSVALTDAMDHARATSLTEIAVHRAAFVGRACPDAQVPSQVRRQRKQAGCGEDDARAERGAGLELAFGAVAMVD